MNVVTVVDRIIIKTLKVPLGKEIKRAKKGAKDANEKGASRARKGGKTRASRGQKGGKKEAKRGQLGNTWRYGCGRGI